MTIATISAVGFVLGATVAYVANRYSRTSEVIDVVGGFALVHRLGVACKAYSTDATRAGAVDPNVQSFDDDNPAAHKLAS